MISFDDGTLSCPCCGASWSVNWFGQKEASARLERHVCLRPAAAPEPRKCDGPTELPKLLSLEPIEDAS